MRVKVICHFDCTYTGVTGHYRAGRVPFLDRAGQEIRDDMSWARARNQQRNYETLTQLIGLFTQPLNISQPIYDSKQKTWEFSFEIEHPGIFEHLGDSLGLLKHQSRGVPMILGLNERSDLEQNLIPDINIKFQEI
jgi:hypothetical protein